MEQFDLEGNYLGQWPGWYNWPQELVSFRHQDGECAVQVAGPGGEMAVSALGAMDDHHMLAPGILTYR